MNGERIVTPVAFPDHNRHVALLLQTILDEVKYTGHDGKTHSVRMEELNPEIGRWLSEEVPVEMGR